MLTQRFRKRKSCIFCSSGKDFIDYRNVKTLYRYLDNRGRIKVRRRTGVCAKHQRKLAKAIKRAREMALLPYK